MFESFQNSPTAQGQKISEPRHGLRRKTQRHSVISKLAAATMPIANPLGLRKNCSRKISVLKL
jgi:hypothetical protein